MDKALLKSEKRYRAIAELAEDSIFVLNDDRTVDFLNSHARSFFHVPSDLPPSPDMHIVFPMGLLDRMEEQIKTVFDYGHSLRTIHQFPYPDEDVWLDSTVVPVHMGDEVVQVIGQLHDISAMVRIEKAVEKQGIVQIEHNMEQFQILNDKIRNPLAIILSLASLTESKESDEIVVQVKKIDDLVTQLDNGWVQSDAVRAFLIKHYGLGKDF